MTDIALIGVGPWGLSVFERLIVTAGGSEIVRLHVVDPGVPGVGAFTTDQPDYLILNTPCGWHSMSPFAGQRDGASLRRTFFDWVQDNGYRWVDGTCRISSAGKPITPDDFLPRRLMGEYLAWSYRVLAAEAPANVEIIEHRSSAVAIAATPTGREAVTLADGVTFTVDNVVLTTGHTVEAPSESHVGIPSLAPYPVGQFADVDRIGRRSKVAIRGMGLVALDVLMALTMGRGGSFVEDGNRLRYLPSGDEPDIAMFSRSGFPYCAKSSSGTSQPSATEYEPAICTEAAIAAACATDATDDARGTSRRPVDFRRVVLPLIFAEMQVRFYSESARQRSGAAVAAAAIDDLRHAWMTGTFASTMMRYAGEYGAFDPAAHVFVGADDRHENTDDYQERVCRVVTTDLAEALRGPESATKAAYAIPRVLRDTLRSVVEFGGLTAESHADFQDGIRTRLSRLIAGPPILRARQLLALIDANVVRLPFGPAPVVEMTSRGIRIRSRHLVNEHREHVEYLIHGTLDEPSLRDTRSPLLESLRDAGRLRELRLDGEPAGSVDLTRDFHPVNALGHTEHRLWVFGPLTEGVRYYTGYLPSPKDQRASRDAAWCVEQMLGHAGHRQNGIPLTREAARTSTARRVEQNPRSAEVPQYQQA